MNEYFEHKREELKPFIPNKSNQAQKVLEIGCGYGGFLENFDYLVEYWGVEPNQQAFEISNQKLFKVYHGIYDDVEDQLPNGYFDLVVCNDVIEHMIDHDEFFEKIKSKLAPNGHILMSIPNVRYLLNMKELLIHQDWQYKDAGILDRTHLRFFTKKSLMRTLKQHNYEILSIEGINGINKISNGLIRNLAKLFMKVIGQSDMLYLQFACVVRLK